MTAEMIEAFLQLGGTFAIACLCLGGGYKLFMQMIELYRNQMGELMERHSSERAEWAERCEAERKELHDKIVEQGNSFVSALKEITDRA